MDLMAYAFPDHMRGTGVGTINSVTTIVGPTSGITSNQFNIRHESAIVDFLIACEVTRFLVAVRKHRPHFIAHPPVRKLDQVAFFQAQIPKVEVEFC